jgi:hypothetical protein
MAVILNADNGVVSGISGLTTTADNSGVLQFQSSGTATLEISTAGNINIPGTGKRITGDFSTSTVANRLMFQSSTTNGITSVHAIPNGTGTVAQFIGTNNSDPTNASNAQLAALSTEISVRSGINGTGTYLPLTMYTGGSERLRIDTSGNVGIGTSSPGDLLQLGRDANNYFAIGNNGSTDALSGIQWRFGSGNTALARIASASSGTNATYLAFSTATSATLTERMRIDSAGNVGIGTSSPLAKLNVSRTDSTLIGLFSGTTKGARIGANSTFSYIEGVDTTGSASYQPFMIGGSDVRFTTSDIERMRITSAGQLLVGTTSWLGGATIGLQIDATNNTSGAYAQLIRNSSGTEIFQMRCDGGLANFSANNANLSDERTKTDIELAGSYLDKICAIPVKTFKYKDQTDDLLNLGVIAQDVEAIAPELVDIGGFGETPEDGIPLKAIYQTDLQYALMKCIQEQQAMINDLKAEVAALKAQG